ncbi:MAG: phosphonate ABC transporter, permease protein PhnE [Betaproteobacteria bacterium]
MLGRPWGRRTALNWLVVVIAVGGVLGWTAGNVELSLGELVRGAGWMGEFLGRMLPPHWGYLGALLPKAGETLQIALWGTLLALVLALPLTFLGARNFSPNPVLYHGVRQIFNAVRGINELVFALLFTAAVGLGPFAGVLALAIHGAGMLGKFFCDAIEEVDPGPVEALRATGARPLQIAAFAVLPQVWPSWISAGLYRFETNLRSATVLGMVGAGGIGFELVASMKLFQYEDTAICVLLILAMVMATDALASRLRAKVLES